MNKSGIKCVSVVGLIALYGCYLGIGCRSMRDPFSGVCAKDEINVTLGVPLGCLANSRNDMLPGFIRQMCREGVTGEIVVENGTEFCFVFGDFEDGYGLYSLEFDFKDEGGDLFVVTRRIVEGRRCLPKEVVVLPHSRWRGKIELSNEEWTLPTGLVSNKIVMARVRLSGGCLVDEESMLIVQKMGDVSDGATVNRRGEVVGRWQLINRVADCDGALSDSSMADGGDYPNE